MSSETIAQLASQFGLEPADVEEIGRAYADASGLLPPQSIVEGIAAVAAAFVGALADLPKTYADPAQRMAADEFAARAAQDMMALLAQTGMPAELKN